MTKRTALAFLTAPLAAAVLLALSSTGSAVDGNVPLYFLVAMAIVFPYAAILTLVLALPAFLVLNRFRLVRWWSAVATGASIGALFATVDRWPGRLEPRELVLMTLVGALSGLVFWVIWRPVTPPNNRWRGP